MTNIKRTILLEKTAEYFAESGYESFSIRKLAKQIPITPSVIYHYFKNEDELLRSMFDYTNTQLGIERKKLPQPRSAEKMFKQRIEFQLDQSEKIVAVLKYYLAYRKGFERTADGFVPDKSSLHIEEVLEYGVKTEEFKLKNLKDDAKVITHAINGFLLEYYPYKPKGKEKKELVDKIFNFLIRALKEANHEHK